MLGVVFFIGMIALYLAASSYATLAANRTYDRVLAGAALSIGETLTASEGIITSDIPYSALDMLSSAPNDKVFYRIVAPDGNTVTGYSDLPPLPKARKQRGDNFRNTGFFEAQYRDEKVHFAYLYRDLIWDGSLRPVAIQVGQTGQARESLSRELTIAALLPIALMTTLALAIVWFGIGFALRPLARLSDELMKREPEDLGEIEASLPAEIEPVIDALNGFMRRLNENTLVLRGFIADAAHQIRTPLAALSGRAQLAQDEAGAELHESVNFIVRDSNRLTRLVNQLLSDATVQHRSDVRRFELVDLVKTIQRAVRDAVPVSDDSDVRFTSSLSNAPCVGDPVMLGELVKNLIHNALLHGKSETGEVLVLLATREDDYVISVSDRGQGIAEDNRSRVFDRFSRIGDGPVSGAGLGLAIVKRVVLIHRGQIALSDRVGGGLTVTVTLPGQSPC